MLRLEILHKDAREMGLQSIRDGGINPADECIDREFGVQDLQNPLTPAAITRRRLVLGVGGGEQAS